MAEPGSHGPCVIRNVAEVAITGFALLVGSKNHRGTWLRRMSA